MNKIIAMIHLLNTKINYSLKSSRNKKGLNDVTAATFSVSFFLLLAVTSLGAVHKESSQIITYFWPLPPSCLQPSAIQGPLPKKDFCKSEIWHPPTSIFWQIDKIQSCHEKTSNAVYHTQGNKSAEAKSGRVRRTLIEFSLAR